MEAGLKSRHSDGRMCRGTRNRPSDSKSVSSCLLKNSRIVADMLAKQPVHTTVEEQPAAWRTSERRAGTIFFKSVLAEKTKNKIRELPAGSLPSSSASLGHGRPPPEETSHVSLSNTRTAEDALPCR